MKILATVCLLIGILLLWTPFSLLSLSRATTQGDAHPSQSAMRYIGAMSMCSVIVGLQLAAGAMFSLQLREWARRLLVVGAAMLIVLKATDLYFNLRATGDASIGSWLPQLLWMVPAAMTIYIFNTLEVKQLFRIATDVRKRAKEGGDVRTASEG
jgi:hypothetical protein